jgi:hypothetical protein
MGAAAENASRGNESLQTQSRRDVLLAVLGSSASFWLSPLARAGIDAQSEAIDASLDLVKHARDWQWLVGNWDVQHRRLKERLAHNDEWEEFPGKSALWLTLGGLGTIDDNLLHLPSGSYRALGIRAFDPQTRQWSIWWLDGRNAGKIDPPVVGGFVGDKGTFVGSDTLRGKPITVRFRWHDIHSTRPHWEQAFSADDGATWEVNWVNFFTRTSAQPDPLTGTDDEDVPQRRDWDFLVGKWHVHNRRLRQRFARSTVWEEFESTLVNWPVLGGFGNVGDNKFAYPGAAYRGMSFRVFDRDSRTWSSWWLDGRSPTQLAAPLRGSFSNGVGTLTGTDTFQGREVKVRSQWSQITARSVHWEQASSADGGATWETNWVSEFARAT